MRARVPVVIVLISSLVFGGCSASQSAQVYSADDARSEMQSRRGVVLGTRSAIVQGKEEQGGALSGGALGGTLGYALGGGMLRPLFMVGGAVAGITVGPWFERHLKRRDGLEIEVRYENGEQAVIVQEDDIELHQGDSVQVIKDSSGKLHVRKITTELSAR